jgi:hypothetical protein
VRSARTASAACKMSSRQGTLSSSGRSSRHDSPHILPCTECLDQGLARDTIYFERLQDQECQLPLPSADVAHEPRLCSNPAGLARKPAGVAALAAEIKPSGVTAVKPISVAAGTPRLSWALTFHQSRTQVSNANPFPYSSRCCGQQVGRCAVCWADGLFGFGAAAALPGCFRSRAAALARIAPLRPGSDHGTARSALRAREARAWTLLPRVEVEVRSRRGVARQITGAQMTARTFPGRLSRWRLLFNG